MSANHEAANEKECSAALRYLLVFLLAACAFAVLLFGPIAAHSTTFLHRSMRTVLQPLRSAIRHESSISETSSDVTLFDASGGSAAAAAFVRQDLEPSTSYTIRVRLAGGTEQFIRVTAPPGGLQLEVRDMTGDSVVNDLVLRPTVVHWPLIVLLNDGHDHFTVVISATLPSSLDSRSRASQSHQIPQTVALTSSGSKADPQPSSRQILVPNLQGDFLPPLAQRMPNEGGHRSVLGRAPPPIARIHRI